MAAVWHRTRASARRVLSATRTGSVPRCATGSVSWGGVRRTSAGVTRVMRRKRSREAICGVWRSVTSRAGMGSVCSRMCAGVRQATPSPHLPPSSANLSAPAPATAASPQTHVPATTATS
uniref:(northern house mosquito) hypothetical protein n=1 Tax=Culex pipiens TaxID=7175 RepID=A0A8D8CFS8_CULPI